MTALNTLLSLPDLYTKRQLPRSSTQRASQLLDILDRPLIGIYGMSYREEIHRTYCRINRAARRCDLTPTSGKYW